VAGTQVAIFAIAFYRTQFGMPRNLTYGIYEISLAIFVLAPLAAGPLVNKYGAKRIAVTSTLLAAFFTMMFFFIPNVWLAVAFDMTHVWFTVIAFVSFACLVLDQVPKYRGTLMSLNSLFNSIGNAIAPAVGGALLVATDGIYGSVGLALGIMAISGSIIMIFLTKDVNRP
jgi:predicted MFS family arabinose efflux permease